MNTSSLLVVGDVHGCYYTFTTLLERHWNPNESLLVQLGDLVDRGKRSPEVVAFCRRLEEEIPQNAVFLKGNHEANLVEYWTSELTRRGEPKYLLQTNSTLREYARAYDNPEERVEEDLAWCAARPLYWSNDFVFASHAGVAEMWNSWEDALREDHPSGILWNRTPLKNIGKLQIIGHTPQELGVPVYSHASHSWNIDTAAVFGVALSALKVSNTGIVLESISIPTDRRDRVW